VSQSALRYRLLDLALGYGLLPDPILRAGSIYGAVARERREARGGIEAQSERLRALLRWMAEGPIAELPEKANEQHYELPAAFLGLILGPRRKYSGCLWPAEGPSTLAAAEEAMLALSCERAGIEDGMRILDLGCGWGSLSIWLGERYPQARITAVSNSSRQRQWIEAEALRRGITNLSVITADVNDFDPGSAAPFDRVCSIEMFEHMRNWKALLHRIGTWLEPERGRAFIHVFSHRSTPYRFTSTWAAERFFTAGLMPSHDLLPRFQEDLVVEDAWMLSGAHYARTLEAWLEQLDERREEAIAILRDDGRSQREARVLYGGWRLFLLSTREIWRHRHGDHWLISHYRLAPREPVRRQASGRAERTGRSRGGSGTKPDVRSM
jgi:cyclopropane-fatty-acyl-phospholipid synthase